MFLCSLGVAELPADPKHLRHHGVSRQAGGTGAPEHPGGGGAAVLEFSVVSFSEGLNREWFTQPRRKCPGTVSPGLAFVEQIKTRRILMPHRAAESVQSRFGGQDREIGDEQSSGRALVR